MFRRPALYLPLLLLGCAQPVVSPQGELKPCVIDAIDAPGWICMPDSIAGAAVAQAPYDASQRNTAVQRACAKLDASQCRALRYWSHPKTRTLYVLVIQDNAEHNATRP